MGSLSLGTCEPDLDAPGRHLGVFFFADEVDLGGADVGVPSELAHLMHRRPVADGVFDRRLAQRVDADAAAAQPGREGEFQTPTFPDKLVVAVRRLNSVSDGKVGVWNSKPCGESMGKWRETGSGAPQALGRE
jgi:hypothetical protein